MEIPYIFSDLGEIELLMIARRYFSPAENTLSLSNEYPTVISLSFSSSLFQLTMINDDNVLLLFFFFFFVSSIIH